MTDPQIVSVALRVDSPVVARGQVIRARVRLHTNVYASVDVCQRVTIEARRVDGEGAAGCDTMVSVLNCIEVGHCSFETSLALWLVRDRQEARDAMKLRVVQILEQARRDGRIGRHFLEGSLMNIDELLAASEYTMQEHDDGQYVIRAVVPDPGGAIYSSGVSVLVPALITPDRML